jgi:DNA-binding LacI/PurR family transcriptional regulator
VNDRVALGAYEAIRRSGFRIPDDIGIIGYGFSETAQLFSPTLSIINQDPRKMGRVAVGMLMDEIQGIKGTQPARVLIGEDFQWNTSLAGTWQRNNTSE